MPNKKGKGQPAPKAEVVVCLTNKQQSKTKNNKAKKNNKKSRKKKGLNGMSGLDVLCGEYCRTLCNPFAPTKSGIPSWPSFNSRILHTWVKGSCFATTANKFAFVAFSPRNAIVSKGGEGDAEDIICVTASAANYAGTTIDTNDGTTGVSGLSSNSPYAESFFTGEADLNQFRLVSAGLRIRYAGTEMARGGTAVGINRPYVDGMGYDDIQAFPLVHNLPLERKWITVLWNPRSPIDLEYFQAYDINQASSWNMAITAYVADASAGGTINFEAFANFEIIGDGVPDAVPRSVSANVYTTIGEFTKASNSGAAQTEEENASIMSKVATNVVNLGVKYAPHLGAFAGGVIRGMRGPVGQVQGQALMDHAAYAA